MLPLTTDNVVCAFKAVTGDSYRFHLLLGIPYQYRDHPLKAAEWWVAHGKDQSWKRIIYALDEVGQTEVADLLMPYSELPSGV